MLRLAKKNFLLYNNFMKKTIEIVKIHHDHSLSR